MNIRIEEKMTYNNVPNAFLGELEQLFTDYGIAYEVVNMDKTPENHPQYVVYEGRQFTRGIRCVKSKVNSEDFARLVMMAWNPEKYGRIADVVQTVTKA